MSQSSARLKIALCGVRSKSGSRIAYSMLSAMQRVAPTGKEQQWLAEEFNRVWEVGGHYEQLRLAAMWYYKAMFEDVWPWDGMKN